jgi:hypothetical protein
MKRDRRWFVILGGAVTIALIAGALFMLTARRNMSSTGAPGGTDAHTISIFFPGERGILERKAVEVAQQLPDKARGEAIFRGLKEMRCIPDRLRLYDLALGKDGVLYLNVSKEFLDPLTPEKEITMTYGLVNSFVDSFRGAKSLQLLIEGQPVYTRAGLLYIFEPLEFNSGVMED